MGAGQGERWPLVYPYARSRKRGYDRNGNDPFVTHGTHPGVPVPAPGPDPLRVFIETL